MNCSHCGGHVTDPEERIHTACVGPAMVERRRLRAEIAARIYAGKNRTVVEAVETADRLLAALDAEPPK